MGTIIVLPNLYPSSFISFASEFSDTPETLGMACLLLHELRTGHISDCDWVPMDRAEGLRVMERNPGIVESCRFAEREDVKSFLNAPEWAVAFIHYVGGMISAGHVDLMFRAMSGKASPEYNQRGAVVVDRLNRVNKDKDMAWRICLGILVRGWNSVYCTNCRTMGKYNSKSAIPPIANIESTNLV